MTDSRFTASLWRSLRHRNYRLYLTGQLVSVCGTWMQQVAQSWLVYRLTGSATLLGLVGFASQIPIFVLGPVGGVASDRFSCRRIELTTQSASLLQALLLALLTLTGWVQVSHIILLGFVLGVVNAFDMPAKQSLVNELVDTEDLPNAIALNSSMFNAARIIGPALAGATVAAVGEGICFLINALSYLAVIWALGAIKLDDKQAPERYPSVVHSLREGIHYVRTTAPIRDLLLLLGLIGVMGIPYMTLLPVFAAEVHKGGADALGLMMGAVGLGALAGALLLARRGHLRGLGKITATATLGFGFGLTFFAASTYFWLSLLILAGVGFAWMVLIAASNTLLQALAADEMRGRVMSLFSMMLVGMAPFGSLVAGWLADRIGAQIVVAVGGFFCGAGGFIFARRLPRLREQAVPILVARGILSDPINPAETDDATVSAR